MEYSDDFIIIFLRQTSEKLFPQKKEEYTKKFLKEWELYKEKRENMATKKISKPKVKIVLEDEEEESPKVNTGCPHILTTGKNSGSICGVSKVLENGFCVRHKDSNILNKTQPDRVIKKHPALKGYWWNPKNKIVFEKKNEEFLVIGTTTKITQGQACRILDLKEEDIQKCKSLNYKINELKVNEAKKKEKAISKGNDDILVIESDDLEDIVLTPPEKVLETPDEIANEVRKILLGDIDDVLSDVKTGETSDEEEEEEENKEEERDITEWINTVIKDCENWDISEESYALFDSIEILNKKKNPNYKLIHKKLCKIISNDDACLEEDVNDDLHDLAARLEKL